MRKELLPLTPGPLCARKIAAARARYSPGALLREKAEHADATPLLRAKKTLTRQTVSRGCNETPQQNQNRFCCCACKSAVTVLVVTIVLL